MQITFHNGDTHEFKSVPEQIYQAFQNSPSKGTFYHKVIAARFHGEKICRDRHRESVKEKATISG